MADPYRFILTNLKSNMSCSVWARRDFQSRDSGYRGFPRYLNTFNLSRHVLCKGLIQQCFNLFDSFKKDCYK
jgi:hypothetical protein